MACFLYCQILRFFFLLTLKPSRWFARPRHRRESLVACASRIYSPQRKTIYLHPGGLLLPHSCSNSWPIVLLPIPIYYNMQLQPRKHNWSVSLSNYRKIVGDICSCYPLNSTVIFQLMIRSIVRTTTRPPLPRRESIWNGRYLFGKNCNTILTNYISKLRRFAGITQNYCVDYCAMPIDNSFKKGSIVKSSSSTIYKTNFKV